MRSAKRTTFFFAILIVGLIILGALDSIAEVKFRTESYKELKKQALQEKKLILIDFRADWCKPCIEMEQTTFLDSTLSEYMNRQFISIKADVDFFDGMDLKEKFNVKQLPAIIVVEPEYEDVMYRAIGKRDAVGLLEQLRTINRPENYDEIPVKEIKLQQGDAKLKQDTVSD